MLSYGNTTLSDMFGKHYYLREAIVSSQMFKVHVSVVIVGYLPTTASRACIVEYFHLCDGAFCVCEMLVKSFLHAIQCQYGICDLHYLQLKSSKLMSKVLVTNISHRIESLHY